MSTRNRARQVPPDRRALSQLSVPALFAFVIVTVLTHLFRLIAAATGLVATLSCLVAEISERIAAAGEAARVAARGPALITTATAGGDW